MWNRLLRVVCALSLLAIWPLVVVVSLTSYIFTGNILIDYLSEWLFMDGDEKY